MAQGAWRSTAAPPPWSPGSLPRSRRPGAGADTASTSRSRDFSKAMTQILRHTAPSLGIEMRPDGFCKASDVLASKPLIEFNTTVDDLTSTVQNNDKKRFATALFDGELFVRAVQGHSIEAVDDGALLRTLGPDDPDLPLVCAHGTYRRHLSRIAEEGLLAGGPSRFRSHVHCVPYDPSDERIISGMRRNCEVVLYLDLRRALRDGVPFFMSSNGVLLSPGIGGVIPAQYVQGVWDMHQKVWEDWALGRLAKEDPRPWQWTDPRPWQWTDP